MFDATLRTMRGSRFIMNQATRDKRYPDELGYVTVPDVYEDQDDGH